MCSGVLREWTRRAEGLRHAMQECMGCKRYAQGGSTSARLCHAQHRVEAKVRTGDYRGRWTRTDDAPKMSF